MGDEAVLRLNFIGDLQGMLDVLEVIHPVIYKIRVHNWRKMRRSRDSKIRETVNWLQQVSDAAYRVMDMVDELQDTRPPAAAKMTRMLPRHAIKKNAMVTKVEETKIKVIELKESHDYYISLEEPANGQQQHRVVDERETGPFFEEASVFGREQDKQRIVALLRSAGRNNTQGPPSCIILPIFGIAGSGKTTLAQLVFNDDARSLQEYNFRVWVYVSPELDFHRIGQSILRQVVSVGGKKEEINDHGSNSYVVGMERIMKCLQELLNGNKVLLVLDDLWEEDSIQLQLLKSMIIFLGDKVDVIVTTCNQAIAWKICTARPYMLNPLGHDTCWELIKKSIRLEEQNEELEKIGLEIASKCWGLPSAAQAIAGMLDSRDPTRWEEVMRTNMWDISVGAYLPSRIMLSTFNLSYMSMPPDLRLCVDYCCNIFPNDHNIGKDDLTHQWIALHLTETFERLSATQVADDYIRRLLDMSFLQTAKSEPARVVEDKGAILFTMHNLAHILTHELRQSKRYSLKTNHCGKLDNDDYARALRCVGCSRMELNNDTFSSKSCLRVLELKESDMQKLPDSICKLRHLRYLKISQFSGLNHLGELVNLVYFDLSDCTGIATLPESFGDLVNLSHIDLSRCHRLSETLEVLRRFVKLVYLDLSFWSCFQGIEKCLGRLTNLEHLNLSNPCCYLSQQHSHLQDIKNVMGKLTKLRYLNLSMCLNHIFYYHKSKEDNLQYIGDCLGGLSSLEHLDLSHNTFLVDLPQILGDLNKLHTLNLSGCIRLKNVGEMKSLKFIALRNCRGLENCKFVVRDIDDDAYSSSNIVQLEDVNCQELQISCLEKVKSKEEAQRIRLVEKQKLEKLKLSWTLDCRRSVEDSALLRELAPPRNLQCLEVNGYNGTCLPEYLGGLTSLQELKIICCKHMIYLPDSIRRLTNLKNLCIFNCPELEKWCQVEDNKKMLAHIPNKNYEEHGSTSRPEIEEDCRPINDMEAE
uniref:Uncharacterized protein n=1 Tax=Avena sativa TaxID=4498 RepID=A0ACD5Z0T5_AVESA